MEELRAELLNLVNSLDEYQLRLVISFLESLLK